MASIIDCKKIQPLLSEYVDGTLAGDSAWGVKLHLSSCAVCARAAEELSATVSLLRSLPREETSDAFSEALARRLADQVLKPARPDLGERVREWWSLPRVRPALAAAGALAALAPAALFFTTRQPVAPVAEPPAVASAGDQQQFLDEVLEEHASYASGEPLGDPTAAVLLVSSAGGEGSTARGDRP